MSYTRTLVTAALPYANGPVHIGHLAGAYLPADIYGRFLRAPHRCLGENALCWQTACLRRTLARRPRRATISPGDKTGTISLSPPALPKITGAVASCGASSYALLFAGTFSP